MNMSLINNMAQAIFSKHFCDSSDISILHSTDPGNLIL